MSGARNRKRSKKITEKDTSLWGFLFSKEGEGEDITKKAFFSNPSGEEDDEDGEEDEPHFLREVWRRFNFWGGLAIAIFLIFTIVLSRTIYRMWTPQDMRDIAGYSDKGTARDLVALLRNANGQEISFTEAEINRFLRETCRMRQTGVFSIITHGNGIAVRIHDGYAELIIDRLIGSNFHQTTAIHLNFNQEVEHGTASLKVNFEGGERLPGDIPRGGSIGLVGLPQRHVSVLAPALDTLRNCYPDICEIINKHGYCPSFTKGKNGQDSRMRLIPYKPS